ncbi:hypothetical protein TRVA0_046S01068 [Trichomonascus vanleenenianus]|uniref:uncharacterized protein n=1 Tax=Trichomonascus vanleenenianus TaxID=2268995 RepID=UPI003EC96AAC
MASLDGLVSETTPLVASEDEFEELEKVHWTKRPSIYMILPLFALAEISRYMLNNVRMNWAITLVCRDQYNLPLSDQDPRCQKTDVQSAVSQYTALCSLIGGLIGLYMLPRISEMSDRVGRKAVFGVVFAGNILTLLSMVVLMKYWRVFGYRSIIATYIITGLFGTNVLITVMMSSYAADCVRPRERAKAMGYVQACVLIGKASGPFLSSRLVQQSGSLMSTFYGSLVLEVLAVCLLQFVVPESISPRTVDNALSAYQRKQREKTEQPLVRRWFNEFNIFDPIRSIFRIARDQSSTVMRNIMVLVVIDLLYELIIAGRAGVAVLYPQMKFGWTTVEIGYLESATACARIILLVFIIPQVFKLLRRVYAEAVSGSGVSKSEIFIVRFGNCLEVLGYTGYGFAQNTTEWIASSFVATSGVIAKPTIQSGLLNMVPKDQIGEFLGAKGVLDGLTSTAFESIGLQVYSFTVERKPELLFYMSATGYFIVICLSLLIKSTVNEH